VFRSATISYYYFTRLAQQSRPLTLGEGGALHRRARPPARHPCSLAPGTCAREDGALQHGHLDHQRCSLVGGLGLLVHCLHDDDCDYWDLRALEGFWVNSASFSICSQCSQPSGVVKVRDGRPWAGRLALQGETCVPKIVGGGRVL